jgi:spermidine/putrescine transport system ATP-binding protein
VFQGPVVRCTLRAPDGTPLVAHVGPEQELPPLRAGLGLWTSWDLDAARLLPPTEGQPEITDEPDLLHTVERATVARP